MIKGLIDADPGEARVRLDLPKNPNEKWLKTQAPGIQAAQVLFDEYERSQTGAIPEQPEIEDLGLTKVGEPKSEPSAGGTIDEAIRRLAPYVRVQSNNPLDIIEAVIKGLWTRNSLLAVPLHREMNPQVHYAHMAILRKNPWIGYHQETDTILQVARNRCVKAFMESEAEWLFFVDGDTIPPFGSPDFWYHETRLSANPQIIKPKFAELKAWERLQSHGKSIVGGYYLQRRRKGIIIPFVDQREDFRLRTEGPRNELKKVPFVATGCMMVHRKVFLDIMNMRPDLAPQNGNDFWNFFGHNVGEGGEDIAFGKLAEECGHPSYLDLAVCCAHIGNFAYFPEQNI